MTLHIVKHVATGSVLPIVKGASWWDPTEEGYDTAKQPGPRIFVSKQAATNFIVAWARGRAIKKYVGGNNPWDDSHEELEFEDVGRTRSMLVAVPVQIIELLNDNRS